MEGVIWCGSVVYGKENKGIEDFGNDEEILGVDKNAEDNYVCSSVSDRLDRRAGRPRVRYGAKSNNGRGTGGNCCPI